MGVCIFGSESEQAETTSCCTGGCLCGPCPLRVAAGLGLLHRVVPKVLAAISVGGRVLHFSYGRRPCAPFKPRSWCSAAEWADFYARTCLLAGARCPCQYRAVQVLLPIVIVLRHPSKGKCPWLDTYLSCKSVPNRASAVATEISTSWKLRVVALQGCMLQWLLSTLLAAN